MSANGSVYLYVDQNGQQIRVRDTDLNFRGPYSAVAVYAARDVADNAGDQYVALMSSTGSLPPSDLSRNTFWSGLILAHAGDTQSFVNLPEGFTFGLMCYYPFDALVAGKWKDAHVYNINLTNNGAQVAPDGAQAQFNGASSYAVSDVSSFDFTGAVSFSCLVTLNNVALDQTIFGKVQPPLDGYRLLFDSAAKMFSFDVWDSANLAVERAINPTVVSAGTKTHVAVAYDRTVAHVWVNGVHSVDASTPYTPAAQNFIVGKDLGGKFLNGKVDELAVWHGRVLTDADVQKLHNLYAGS